MFSHSCLLPQGRGNLGRFRCWLAAVAMVILGGTQPVDSHVVVQLSSTTVRQGQAVAVQVRAQASSHQLRVVFAGRSWPLYRARDGWLTYLGTDPTTTPGRRTLTVEVVTVEGSQVLARRSVTVVRVVFPARRITFDPEQLALLDPKLVELERTKVRAALRVLHDEQIWEGSFATPVSGILASRYGVLSIYQGRRRGFHHGVDLTAATGTPVRAANHGTVRLAEALPLSGNAVLIDHGLGVVTSYFHLSDIRVEASQRVRKGQIIGSVGRTGLATGPHLHWGLRTNGVHVDPLPWTNFSRQ